MSNGKIYYLNLLNSYNISKGTCTLNTSSEQSTFTKNFLYDCNKNSLWRSTSISTQTINISFSSPVNIKAVFCLNHNILVGETLTFEACTNSLFSPPSASIPINPLNNFIETDLTFQYYRISLQKLSGSYIQIGELLLFQSIYEFEDSCNWGFKRRKTNVFNSTQTTSGQIYRNLLYSQIGFELPFSGISDTQQNAFEIISTFPYCVLDVDEIQYYGFITFSDFTKLSPNFWECTLYFTENP